MTRFGIFALLVAGAFTALTWRGVNLLPTTAHATIPASVRSSPGGYRSYHTYHGFHGGK